MNWPSPPGWRYESPHCAFAKYRGDSAAPELDGRRSARAMGMRKGSAKRTRAKPALGRISL
jgi:hypothetical protein